MSNIIMNAQDAYSAAYDKAYTHFENTHKRMYPPPTVATATGGGWEFAVQLVLFFVLWLAATVVSGYHTVETYITITNNPDGVWIGRAFFVVVDLGITMLAFMQILHDYKRGEKEQRWLGYALWVVKIILGLLSAFIGVWWVMHTSANDWATAVERPLQVLLAISGPATALIVGYNVSKLLVYRMDARAEAVRNHAIQMQAWRDDLAEKWGHARKNAVEGVARRMNVQVTRPTNPAAELPQGAQAVRVMASQIEVADVHTTGGGRGGGGSQTRYTPNASELVRKRIQDTGWLDNPNGVTQDAIAAECGVSKGTVSAVVRKMKQERDARKGATNE